MLLNLADLHHDHMENKIKMKKNNEVASLPTITIFHKNHDGILYPSDQWTLT